MRTLATERTSRRDHAPFLDDVAYLLCLVYGTIVHYDDGLGRREWVHLQYEIFDERSETFGVEGALDDCTLDDAIKCDRWKDGVPIA